MRPNLLGVTRMLFHIGQDLLGVVRVLYRMPQNRFVIARRSFNRAQDLLRVALLSLHWRGKWFDITPVSDRMVGLHYRMAR